MFTSDGALALRTILNFADRVFSVTIPGTSITFKGFFLGILVTCFTIAISKKLLNSLDIFVQTDSTKPEKSANTKPLSSNVSDRVLRGK